MKRSETTENKIRRFFDQLYQNRQNRSMRQAAAYPVYLELLQAKPEDRLLDIGCGPGWLLKAGSEMGLDCVGVDLSPAAIRLCLKNAPKASALVAGVNNLPFRSRQFSLVCCIGVFEHFLNPESAAKEMRRVASKGARFCLLLPNSQTLRWKWSEWFGTWNEEANENAFSLMEWQKILQDLDFRIMAIYRDWWQVRRMAGALGIRYSSPLYNFICRILEKLIPLKFAHQFIFVLEDNKRNRLPE